MPAGFFFKQRGMQKARIAKSKTHKSKNLMLDSVELLKDVDESSVLGETSGSGDGSGSGGDSGSGSGFDDTNT